MRHLEYLPLLEIQLVQASFNFINGSHFFRTCAGSGSKRDMHMNFIRIHKKKILNRVSKYTITNTHTHKKEDGDHKFCHIKASSLPYNAHIFLHKNIKRSCLLSAYRTKSRLLENWYAYWFSFQTAVLQKLIQTERWKRTEVWPA